jgi:hypothetical protein
MLFILGNSECTFVVCVQTKKADTPGAAKPRPKGNASGGLLPPPPGGVKVAAPMQPAHPSPEHHAAPSQPKSNMDLLVDFGAPAQPPSNPAPSRPADPWGDFAAAG